ncbi:MAG: alpha/beta fold hydrolase [Pirellulales bacterium]|nr:alpha/beta fold hydrolase [Pirellulales bacterium]
MTNSTESWRSLYPFASHELNIGGLRYHYLDEGAGPTLLLVHGNPTWSFYWRELVSALRERYRLIVPDHIGCGLSDKPSPRAYPYRLARRVEDLCRLIEHLNLEKVTLVAHDWGGAIGMGAAVALPQRFARFVLMNTAAYLTTRCPRRIRLCHVPGIGQLAVQGLNLFVRLALREATAKPERMTPPVRAGLAAPYDSWPHRAAVYRFVKDIPLRPRHPTYQTLKDIEAGLAQFRNHPVCLIWGMKDWCFTPWFLDRFLNFFPQAVVHRIADAGHYVVEDAHEQIIPMLRAFMEQDP